MTAYPVQEKLVKRNNGIPVLACYISQLGYAQPTFMLHWLTLYTICVFITENKGICLISICEVYFIFVVA